MPPGSPRELGEDLGADNQDEISRQGRELPAASWARETYTEELRWEKLNLRL